MVVSHVQHWSPRKPVSRSSFGDPSLHGRSDMAEVFKRRVRPLAPRAWTAGRWAAWLQGSGQCDLSRVGRKMRNEPGLG